MHTVSWVNWYHSPRLLEARRQLCRTIVSGEGPWEKGWAPLKCWVKYFKQRHHESIRVSWARSVGGMGDLPRAVPCRRGVTGFCFDMTRSLRGFVPGGSSSYSWNNFTIESKFVLLLISSTFARRCFIKFWSDFSVWRVRCEEKRVCDLTFCIGLSSVPYLYNTSNKQNARQWLGLVKEEWQ